jgi:hypothetical protein
MKFFFPDESSKNKDHNVNKNKTFKAKILAAFFILKKNALAVQKHMFYLMS